MNSALSAQITTATDRAALVELANALIAIESVHDNECAVASHIAEYLAAHGISARLVGDNERRKSLVAEFGSGQNSFMLNGHLDTVTAGDHDRWSQNPFSSITIDGRLYGRGSLDMKGAVAAATQAAIAIHRAKKITDGRLMLVFNYDEEGGDHTGIRDILSRGIRADAAICCEPTPPGVIQLGSRGVYRFELVTRGTSGHTAYPSGKVNAVTKMAKLLLALESLSLTYTPHSLFAAPHITPGTVINGGCGINTFPERCSALVDCRLSLGQSEEAVYREILECLTAAQKSDPEIEFTMNRIAFVPASLVDSTALIASLANEVFEQQSGMPASFEVAKGAADANFLVEAGIPTVVLGPTGAGMHDADEYVELDSLERSMEYYARMAVAYLQRVSR